MAKAQRRTRRHPDKWKQRARMRGFVRWQRQQQAMRDVHLAIQVVIDHWPAFHAAVEAMAARGLAIIDHARAIREHRDLVPPDDPLIQARRAGLMRAEDEEAWLHRSQPFPGVPNAERW